MFPDQPNPFSSPPASSALNQNQGAATPFYQIKPDDTFDSVSQNTGVPLNGLVKANNNMKSLPPTGSYIQTGGLSPDERQKAPSGITGVPPVGYGQPKMQAAPQTYNASQNFFPNADALNAARQKVNQQVKSGVLPATVDYRTPIIDPSTNLPVSDKKMQANGYTFDSIKKTWVLGGTATNGVSGVPASATPVANGYIDDKGKFTRTVDAQGNAWDATTATRDIYGDKFIQVGQIKWERVNGKLRRVQYGKGGKKTVLKTGGGGGGSGGSVASVAAAPVQPIAGTTESNVTVLGLHLGSG